MKTSMNWLVLTPLLLLASCRATPTPVDPGLAASKSPPLMFPGPGATLQWTQYTATTTFTVPTGIKGYSVQGCGAGGGGGAGQNGGTCL